MRTDLPRNKQTSLSLSMILTSLVYFATNSCVTYKFDIATMFKPFLVCGTFGLSLLTFSVMTNSNQNSPQVFWKNTQINNVGFKTKDILHIKP